MLLLGFFLKKKFFFYLSIQLQQPYAINVTTFTGRLTGNIYGQDLIILIFQIAGFCFKCVGLFFCKFSFTVRSFVQSLFLKKKKKNLHESFCSFLNC